MPLSITLWQHLYSLNVLLVIQETADTFGLVCLGLLFLSAQIFSRNSMLSIFLLSSQNSTISDASKTSTESAANRTASLSLAVTSLNHFKLLLSSSTAKIKSTIRM